MHVVHFGLICGILSFTATEAHAQQINPVARAVSSTTLHAWTFDETTEGWTAENQCRLSNDDGCLVIRSAGTDPFFHSPVELPGGRVAVTLRVRAGTPVGGGGSVFWTTDQQPRRGEDKRADFKLIGDGKWHETTARFLAPGELTDLRIDPGTLPGIVQIDWIRLAREQLHPLTISAVTQAQDGIQFTVTNHGPDPVACQINGAARTVKGNGSLEIVRAKRRDQPLEVASLAIECGGWPTLKRNVWSVNPDVPVDWIEQPLTDGKLQVAPDGSIARIMRNGKPVAVLGPLVHFDSALPRFERISDGAAIRFQNAAVDLQLAANDDEIQITIDSKAPCEGPVVRVDGPLEQGLFAGLEYLGKRERSSSSLDIETDEHIRFAPDPLKVTMPLMAFVTPRDWVAMTWDDMQLQPVYATPNFFDGTDDHRMALRGKKIVATIRLGKGPLDDAILWAVRKHGLPPIPRAPRTGAAQDKICLTALNGPLRTDQGWGHCVQDRWQRRPFADMASTVWRLGGTVPEFPRWVPGGAHVPNGTIYFVTGQTRQWLDSQRGQIGGLIRRQQPDGSYRYDGEYRRGHFENTASGVCAFPAARLLDYAYVTGDQRAMDAGLRTLEFMQRFRTPRGAQVWECALHTPDQLASAYLVWAYVRGYQLTGKQEYLRCARKWALSGLPFTYLWHVYPIMAYATPPVYGATHWKAPNWMGLPVQWVGSVYAYALTLLAPFEHSLDWNHVARGILVCAQQQQYPDGPHVGLLPDSFNIRFQRRQPADINPCALVSLQRSVDGQVDFLSVATDGMHRVAAPFKVTLQDGKAHIRARAGVAYQILIDGRHIVDVASDGSDIVDLAAY